LRQLVSVKMAGYLLDMLETNLEPSWQRRLSDHLQTPSMEGLKKFLGDQKAAGKHIYPAEDKIFNAFALTPFPTVKVVILGQDPYHGPGQAHGLSFSVEADTPIPPSLRNIFKELQSDIGMPPPRHGNLEAWARQGVLLLNNCLTVENSKAGSHQNKGWEPFTDAVMTSLNAERVNIVFILWGRKAQEKGRCIDPSRHLVIASAHPSPLSAHNGFFGSKPFSRTNAYLTRHHLQPVDWHLRTETAA
jgi:uracil-DNA glycosylase